MKHRFACIARATLMQLACMAALTPAVLAQPAVVSSAVIPGERVSEWLLRNAAPDADVTSLHWQVQAERPSQGRMREAVVQSLYNDPRVGLSSDARAQLADWLRSLPLIGRLTLAIGNARWLQAASSQDPVLGQGQAMRLQINRAYPYTRGTVIWQPLDWLEGGFRYSQIDNRLSHAAIRNQARKDKSIDFKLRLHEESAIWPQLALGVRDLGGTGLLSGEYLAGCQQTLGKLGRQHWAGLDWGYLDARGNIKNPFSAFGDRFNTRPGNNAVTGGQAILQSMFRGLTALFGGLQWHSPHDPLVLNFELDGNVGDLGGGHYASVYGGMLESMYGGVGAEWLYRPWHGRIAWGVDVNHVRQRDFRQNLGFHDYSVNIGHATMYWDTGWNDVQVNLSVVGISPAMSAPRWRSSAPCATVWRWAPGPPRPMSQRPSSAKAVSTRASMSPCRST